MSAPHHARVDEHGKLQFHDERRYEADLQRFAGKRVEVYVRLPRKQRSTNANAYYWYVVNLIADETGETDPEQVHLGFRFRYLKISDHPMPKARSTTDLDTKEFAEYLDKILTDAAMGEFTGAPMWIPRPGEGDAPW